MAEYLKIDRPLVDHAGAVDETCLECGGKGFHWKRAHIISRVDGKVVADTYTRGDPCQTCGGFGTRRVRRFSLARIIGGFLLSLPVVGMIWLIMHL